MTTLKQLRESAPNEVRISFNVGTLVIDSSYPEWVNPTTKIIKEGVTLHWDDETCGYMTLNLNRPRDRKIYERYQEWVADGDDTRILTNQVHELKDGAAAPPFPWWDNSTAEKLYGQIVDGVEAMDDPAQRRALVERAVTYEAQNKNRKVLIDKLLNIDLDVDARDELNPED